MKNTKAIFKCPEAYKARFSSSTCLLTISVGQEVHEGEKFSATIELVNANFNACIMLIDDSLQRHTMALNTNEDASFFYEISLREGELWLQRNEKYFSNLKILKSIIHWDNWLFHENFLPIKEKIMTLLKTDSEYKIAFDNTIDEFLHRYHRRLIEHEKIDINRARLLCQDYLLEECTAVSLWPELNCHFEVYPSKRNLAMQATHERFVIPKHPNLLHPVSIKFKNRKQLKPQQFSFEQEKIII